MDPMLWKARRGLLLTGVCLAMLALVGALLAQIERASAPAEAYLPIVTGGTGSPPVVVVVTGTLADGGTIIVHDGLHLGTVSNTISTSLQITVALMEGAPQPMLAGATPAGSYYHISAAADFYTPVDKPFVLGLPVPAGTITANLGVAVLLPLEPITDSAAAELRWLPLLGRYDATQRLFLITLSGLLADGATFVLIAHPDLEPLSLATPFARQHEARAAATIPYQVNCFGFASVFHCLPQDEIFVEQELMTDHVELVDNLQFRAPALGLLLGGVVPLQPTLAAVTLLPGLAYHNIFIEPLTSCGIENRSARGRYVRSLPALYICKDPQSAITLEPDIEGTIRHELFHAVQFAYPLLRSAAPFDTWVVEGTATAAEYSQSGMVLDPNWKRRAVDASLTLTESKQTTGAITVIDPNVDYQTQDFWVFTGLDKGEGLDYLQPLFEQGLETKDVVDLFGDGDYMEAYWSWASNQVMEKKRDLGGALQNPCHLEAGVVDNLLPFNFHWDVFPTDTQKLVNVLPLSTAVVKLKMDFDYDAGFVYIVLTDTGQDPGATAALRFKVYVDGEGSCASVPEGPRLFEQKDGGMTTAEDYIIVISNIDYDEAYDYTIRLEVAPTPPTR